MKRVVLALLFLVAGCWNGNDGVLRVAGLLEGIDVRAGTLVGGRVSRVHVVEGSRVSAGDLLVELDPKDTAPMVAAAEARLRQTAAILAKLEAGARPEQLAQAEAAAEQARQQYSMALDGARSQEIDAARAAAEAARAQRDDAQQAFERARRLFETGAASEMAFDHAKNALSGAQANYTAALEKLDLVAEGARVEEVAMAKAAFDQARALLDELRNGARVEDIEAARAARDAAKADLELAQSRLEEMRVLAPMAGLVETIDIEPGDLVPPGPVVRLIDPDTLEVVVYISAPLLSRIRMGQRIPLLPDGGGAAYEGEVIFIANEGEFMPRNLQTEESRARQVFGIRLRVPSYDGALKAGMTVTAQIPLNGAALP
ncbi:MAG: HlyD family secretion protein [Candidatus Hydrogenedentales bacterium]|jgi:HlyD family secretion protein